MPGRSATRSPSCSSEGARWVGTLVARSTWPARRAAIRLLLSGIGPRRELDTAGVRCLVDSPHVGKHLKDHLHVPLFFPAPGVGVPMLEIAISTGPAALRHPAGPLPADPRDDEKMPANLQALKREAERRLAEWETTGCGLASSPLYDACAWFSTGLGDHHSHDAQIGFIPCSSSAELW